MMPIVKKIRSNIALLPLYIKVWLAIDYRPSLFLLTVINFLLWGLIFGMADDMATRRTTRFLGAIAPDWVWTSTLVGSAIMMLLIYASERKRLILFVAWWAASFNVFLTLATGLSVYPQFPALISGQICVTLGSLLAFACCAREEWK